MPDMNHTRARLSVNANVGSSAASAFARDAGALCLDFANTLERRYDPLPRASLPGYAALVAFAEQSGALDAAAANTLRAAAEREPRPRRVEAALRAALTLREALFRLFSAIAAGAAPAADDLAALNAAPAGALAHGRVAREHGRYVWSWDADPAALDRPLWPIVQSAANLLLEGDLSRLRQCAAGDCAWLFLDTSRNHSRHWRSMPSCGNRAKVREFRERKRATTPEG